MTNTKFRKRALLSSVAMLLVALVALGSATFAWFQANPEVSANQLKMQATAGAGIQIASEYALIGKSGAAINNTYGYSTVLEAADATLPLDPASVKYTDAERDSADVAFGWVSGTSSSNGTAKGTFADASKYTVTSDPKSGRVFYEDIYLKSTNGDEVPVTSALVRITSTTHTNKEIEQGVKVALVKPDGTIIAIWKANSGQNTKVWNGSKTADTPASDLETLTNADTVYKSNNTSATISDFTVAGKVKGESGAQFIRMYVYLDGENQYVVSDNALTATELFSAIDVKFSTAASISPMT